MTFVKRNRAFIHYLPVYGCIATAIIYITIGIIALLSFLKIRDGGADESSMLALFNEYTIGKIVIWLILTGTLCYIIWRIFESITDPYGYGNDRKGIAKRIGIAVSTFADVLIVYTAVRVLLGVDSISVHGLPEEEQALVKKLLAQTWGQRMIMAMGAVLMMTALFQFIYGISKGYHERLDLQHARPLVKRIIHFLGLAGYSARGIIIGITGFFFIKAGVLEDESYIVNTDKAFDFIGDHVGHLYFILVALGTICYGLFMLSLGAAYHSREKKK